MCDLFEFKDGAGVNLLEVGDNLSDEFDLELRCDKFLLKLFWGGWVYKNYNILKKS